MSLRIYFSFFIALFFLSACNKQEAIVKPVTGNNLSQLTNSTIDTSRGWYGLYTDLYQSPDDTTYHTLSDKYIIANGEAKIPYGRDILVNIIRYDIPSNQTIHGDSTTFKLALQNKSNIIQVNLIGIKNTAKLYYYTYEDTGHYEVALGTIVKRIKVFPATDFNNFKVVKFAFNKSKLSVYVQNKLITSFNYSTKNRMGAVKQISLGTSGYIECDFVWLLNTFAEKLIMREEFNHNGESHTVFNP